jgi:SAM-dependent methyltransferase
MEPDNQHLYWDRVAASKTFTHPVDLPLLQQHLALASRIVDYGCGYGRSLAALHAAGFTNLWGVDTSAALIQRGQQQYPALATRLQHIAEPRLPLPDAAADAILLLAVLTCIPSNAGQQALLAHLYAKLRPGGLLYLSDYYLQPERQAAGAYHCLHGDPANEGVFTLPEGVTFRHHTPAWISTLTAAFTVLHNATVPVFTMNGNRSEAFQLLLQKPASGSPDSGPRLSGAAHTGDSR